MATTKIPLELSTYAPDADGATLELQTTDTTVTDGSVLGKIEFKAPKEASGTDALLVGAAIEAVAEGTFAADNNATELVFKTGESEAATQKMVITSGGSIGIGTAAPSANVHISNSGQAILRVEGVNQYYTGLMVRNNYSSTQSQWHVAAAGGTSGWGAANGNFIIRDDTTNSTAIEAEIGAGGASGALYIDANGHITAPFQPYFEADRNGNQTGFNATSAGDVVVVYNREITDVNGDYNTSTGKFTAPVDGIYYFMAATYTASDNMFQQWLVVNTARVSRSDWVMSAAQKFTNYVGFLKLDANDTVGYHPYTASNSSVTINENINHTYFRGGLLQ